MKGIKDLHFNRIFFITVAFEGLYSGIRISGIAVRFLFFSKFGKTFLQTFADI